MKKNREKNRKIRKERSLGLLILLAGLLLCGCGSSEADIEADVEVVQKEENTAIIKMEELREETQQSSSPTEEVIETDIHKIIITRGNDGKTFEFSQTMQSEAFWEIIEKYQALDVKKSENQTPTTGYTYWLKMYDEAGEKLHSVTPKGENIEIDNVRYQDHEKGTAARLFLTVDALCGERKPMGEIMPTDRQEIDTLEGVTLEMTYATSMGANLLLTNTTDKRIIFGEDYSLQTKVKDTWYEVGYIIEDWAFPSIGYEILNGDTLSWSTRWQIFHGELEPGDYRIIKSVLDSREPGDFTEYYLGVEFTVE